MPTAAHPAAVFFLPALACAVARLARPGAPSVDRRRVISGRALALPCLIRKAKGFALRSVARYTSPESTVTGDDGRMVRPSSFVW